MSTINLHQQQGVLAVNATAAGSKSASCTIQSDSALIMLWAPAVSGTVNVVVYGQGPDGSEFVQHRYETLSAPTPVTLYHHTGPVTAKLRIVATYTDACEVYVHVKAQNSPAPPPGPPTSVYDTLLVTQLSPYVSLLATKGLQERLFETYSSGAGASAAETDLDPGHALSCVSGTSVGGYGVIRSKKVLSYRAGVGLHARFSAKFSAPQPSSIQRAGMFNIGNEITIGYDSERFGLLVRTGGRPEIRKLTLTVPAAGAETVTVQLNGVSFNVAVTAGTLAQNAATLAAASYTGWVAYNDGDSVFFEAQTVDAKNGTYSVTSTGALAGTFTTYAGGKSVTDTWFYQEDWNVNAFIAGDGPFELDPTENNFYKIQYSLGEIALSILNPATGKFTLAHRVTKTNTTDIPVIDLPEFKIGIIAANISNTTPLTVSSYKLSGFYENFQRHPGKAHSHIEAASSVGTTLTNVLACFKAPVANNRLEITDIQIMRITLACEGTKPAIFEIRLNPDFSAQRLWTSRDEDTAMFTSSTGGTVSNGEIIYTIGLGKSSSITLFPEDLDIILSNRDVLSIAVRATSGTTDATASVVWMEK